MWEDNLSQGSHVGKDRGKQELWVHCGLPILGCSSQVERTAG